jgi:hypothetical protein
MAIKIFDPIIYANWDPDEELVNEAAKLIHEANEILDEDDEDIEEGTQLEFDFGDEKD